MTDSPNSDNNPLALSPEERRQLAQAFSATMDEGESAAADDRAWKEELLRRVTEMRNGTAETLSADEAFAHARRMFGEDSETSAAPSAQTPEEVEAAWAEQIRVRMADFMAGREPSADADEVFARLRAHRGGSGSA